MQWQPSLHRAGLGSTQHLGPQVLLLINSTVTSSLMPTQGHLWFLYCQVSSLSDEITLDKATDAKTQECWGLMGKDSVETASQMWKVIFPLDFLRLTALCLLEIWFLSSRIRSTQLFKQWGSEWDLNILYLYNFMSLKYSTKTWAVAIAQRAKHLPRMHKALGLIPSTTYPWVWWHMPIIPALQRWRQKNKKFK